MVEQLGLAMILWWGSLIVRSKLRYMMYLSFDGLKKKDSSEQSVGDFLQSVEG